MFQSEGLKLCLVLFLHRVESLGQRAGHSGTFLGRIGIWKVRVSVEVESVSTGRDIIDP